MNDSPRFDETRSAAIRSALIDAVEQSPRRDRRRHVRIAVAAVLAALGLGLGGTAVAFAVSGTDLFGGGIVAAPPATSTPTPDATSAPDPSPSSTAPAPHPLVVADAPILPRDVLTTPAATPAWSVQLPGVNDKCTYAGVLDVSDGFALFQSGPNSAPEDSNYECDLSASHYALTLIDTSTGAQLWTREWSWAFTQSDPTTATLLGTSGRVLVWDFMSGPGPKEVLDLATGETLASVTEPAGFDVTNLYPVPGDSGDVSFVAQKLDDAGQPTASWAVMRADPRDLAVPRWSVPIEAERVMTQPIQNSSSILQVQRQPSGELDVYDVDSGALMVGAATDREYDYYDGFTLRISDSITYQIARTVAGIDDAGNEMWSRTLDSGYAVAPVRQIGARPGGAGSALASQLLLIGPGTQLELIDGPTGKSLWTADGSTCRSGAGLEAPAVDAYGFSLTADGVILQSSDTGSVCGFDHATGAAVDVSSRPGTWAGVQGVLAQYQLDGAGMGTGGLYTDPTEVSPPTPMPQSGTGTALDAVTGATLWSVPVYYDERWTFAGGYLVGISQGKVFGIG